MDRILVVDDEEIMRESLTDWLKEDGYEVLAVEDGFKALEAIQKQTFSVMLVDLKMPKMDGLEVLREVKRLGIETPVIIITAYATVDTAVAAMKEGAYDYIIKPFNPEELGLAIKKIIEHQHLKKENILLRKELSKRYQFQDIIGKSPKMQAVFELIRTVAPTKSTVLIQGESGTGKEMVARAIHEASLRKDGPFIALACGALPETLLEAELFGHEKGAFTGANFQKKGKLELADGGTLFLDEIGDISPKSQVDLLRFLQEREFRRLGGTETIKVDVRIIAATNKNLLKLVEQGKFRDDLYYRLNVITITLPPLRERKEDIPLLITHFLEKYNIETGKRIEKISEAAMNILMDYHWPGNVRELENTIEHAVVVSEGNTIMPNSLPDFLKKKEPTPIDTSKSLEEMEKQHIIQVLKEQQGNISRAAEILGINRVTLYRKMKEYDIKIEDSDK
ncbi:MAG: sigma-54 dependent transcriptional regulator [candidate division WOR-3 bacterium]